MAKEAWAANAVIVEDNGFQVRFRPRCPRCGHVPINMTMAGTASVGVRANYSARCEKCGEYMDITISRG